MEKNQFVIRASILECNSGNFVGSDGVSHDYMNALIRFGGRVVKIGSKVDLTAFVDKGEKELTCQLVPGQNMAAKVRIVSIK